MIQSRKHYRTVRLAALVLFAGFAVSLGAGEPPRSIGEVYSVTTGVVDTAGTPVVDGAVVKAVSHGSLVRLDGGHVLRFASNSSAVFDVGSGGDVTVTVLSGRVAAFDGSGRPSVAGQRAVFTLGPRAADGERVEQILLELDLETPGRIELDGQRSARSSGR